MSGEFWLSEQQWAVIEPLCKRPMSAPCVARGVAFSVGSWRMIEVRQPLWQPQWLLRRSGSRLWLIDAVRTTTRFGVRWWRVRLNPGFVFVTSPGSMASVRV